MKLIQILLITIISYTNANQCSSPNNGPIGQSCFPQYQYVHPDGNYGYYNSYLLQPPPFALQGCTRVVNTIDSKDYTKIHDRYYLIQHDTKRTWYGAALYCRGKGLDLVTIQNQEEMLAISNHLTAIGFKGGDFFWTSGNDHEIEGLFKSLSTGLPMVYSKWSESQPDNYAGVEHCIELWFVDKEFYMNDRTCNKLAYFICEVPLPKVGFCSTW